MINKVILQLLVFTFLVFSCNSKSSEDFKESDSFTKEEKESIHPIRVNQQFITSFNEGDTLTVKSFFGDSGVEYPTYEEALVNSDDKSIIIKNVEYGGATEWKRSYLVGSTNLKEVLPPLQEN
ncbi:hypothetical protein [Neolewinella persica]|uniref:hypothetical protein n=1 Tax=Neolewinella persica TaxID=70998 RepID=UPI000381D24C|nr:hypothetical protein [Neolewinella persica]